MQLYKGENEMKILTSYRWIEKWYADCDELMDTFQSNDKLTMELEWAILQNFKTLSAFINQFNEKRDALQAQYSTLQEDGTKVLETDNPGIMDRYYTAIESLKDETVKINIIKVNHKNLSGIQGVSLEVMALLNFMIA